MSTEIATRMISKESLSEDLRRIGELERTKHLFGLQCKN